MSYSLTTLWYDRQRFLPGVLAVSFSAVLIALQCGLLLGLFSVVSLPIDHTRADIWLGAPDVLSIDVAQPIPEWYLSKLAGEPEVAQCETYVQAFAQWVKPTGGAELCIVCGSHLEKDSLGAVHELTPQLRTLLTEPGSVVVDDSELDRLSIKGIGATSEINGHRVRVVGMLHGLKSIAGPYIYCSMSTAQLIVSMRTTEPYKATYILARLHPGANANEVVQRLRDRDAFAQERIHDKDEETHKTSTFSVFTASEFSLRSRLHWLFKTKAGIALGYAALLGLLVGAVVTSQTLYAATAASIREYAVLQALGIPRWRMAMAVVSQSFWVGISGVLIAYPTVFCLAWVAGFMGAKVLLPPELLCAAGVVTLVMAVLSGLAAMRSLRMVEPAILLR